MANLRLNGHIIDHGADWLDFKKWLNGTYSSLRYTWVEDDVSYVVVAVDGIFTRTVGINKDSGSDQQDFEQNYKLNKVIEHKTADGKQVVSLWPTEGSRATSITPNWCDRTTWYVGAVRVENEVVSCSNPGTYTQYVLSHNNIIDVYHGKISDEDDLRDINNNNYRVVVKVNDIIKVEQDPHLGSGGDYIINYNTGVITFINALVSTDVVISTYHYENGSDWILKPAAGKILKIKSVEAQFTSDVVLNDSVIFQLYVGGGPYGPPKVYKTFLDFVNEANGAYPAIAAVGGSNWRALQQSVYAFPWNYTALTDLKSSLGMEVRIKLQHNNVFGGTAATAAFYCLAVTE